MTAPRLQPLTLFNTLGRRPEVFRPLHPPSVGLYSCGPTVYSYAHVGNLRAYVFSDILRRALRWKGYEVTQVVNITDVGHLTSDEDTGEDKLELASRREDRSIWDIARHYTEAFFEDLRRLAILPADHWPRATDHIDEMIAFASRLEARGYTYRLPSGLYFDTTKIADYGRLALLDVAGLREGARVEAIEGKRSKTDFAVWRTAAADEHRLMQWDSPWGPGAPGWHLECSVMSMRYLGEHFDLHTGGVDHIPVHHVNEIAQSEAWLEDGEPWVRTWLHNEFVVFRSGKMSKSAGGTVRLTDLLELGIHPLAYRFFLLGAHYRTQVSFSPELVAEANVALRRLVGRVGEPVGDVVVTFAEAATRLRTPVGVSLLEALDAAISDDLNTPRCLALTHQIAQAPDAELDAADREVLLAAVQGLLGLGLDCSEAELDVEQEVAPEDAAVIDRLVAERDRARSERRFADADALRDELAAMDVELADGPTGTTWRRRERAARMGG